MKVVAAPNPFKGSIGAAEAAAAIARGVRQVFPAAELLEVPIADGGEGTVEALVAAHGGRLVWETVEGPLGGPVSAALGLLDGGRTAVVELAAAAGLPLVPAAERDPRHASTYGFGQLLEAARRLGVERIITGIGGSATNDGGAGMAQALGYRLFDREGRELPRGGAPLAGLVHIDAGGVDPGWGRIRVDVACDVTNPLTGPEGATVVYGPQKGVTPDLVPELDAACPALVRLAAPAPASWPFSTPGCSQVRSWWSRRQGLTAPWSMPGWCLQGRVAWTDRRFTERVPSKWRDGLPPRGRRWWCWQERSVTAGSEFLTPG
jgi:glycerate kinase